MEKPIVTPIGNIYDLLSRTLGKESDNMNNDNDETAGKAKDPTKAAAKPAAAKTAPPTASAKASRENGHLICVCGNRLDQHSEAPPYTMKETGCSVFTMMRPQPPGGKPGEKNGYRPPE